MKTILEQLKPESRERLEGIKNSHPITYGMLIESFSKHTGWLKLSALDILNFVHMVCEIPYEKGILETFLDNLIDEEETEETE